METFAKQQCSQVSYYPSEWNFSFQDAPACHVFRVIYNNFCVYYYFVDSDRWQIQDLLPRRNRIVGWASGHQILEVICLGIIVIDAERLPNNQWRLFFPFATKYPGLRKSFLMQTYKPVSLWTMTTFIAPFCNVCAIMYCGVYRRRWSRIQLPTHTSLHVFFFIEECHRRQPRQRYL